MGLGQRDPDAEPGGREGKGRGETGREQDPGWVTSASLLGDTVTEGEVTLEGEEKMGGTGATGGSDGPGATGEGTMVRVAGAVGGAPARHEASEEDPDIASERVFGPAAEGPEVCGGSEGEAGTDAEEPGTEEGMGESGVGEGGRGEVMCGIGEARRVERGKAEE